MESLRIPSSFGVLATAHDPLQLDPSASATRSNGPVGAVHFALEQPVSGCKGLVRVPAYDRVDHVHFRLGKRLRLPQTPLKSASRLSKPIHGFLQFGGAKSSPLWTRNSHRGISEQPTAGPRPLERHRPGSLLLIPVRPAFFRSVFNALSKSVPSLGAGPLQSKQGCRNR